MVGLILASGRCASAARRAVDVAIPLRLPLRWIERAVKEQLFNGPEGTCTFVADETICRFYLSRPKLDARRKMLRLTCEADVLYAGAGEAACVDPRRWRGQATLLMQPRFEAAGRRLGFKVVEAAFSDREHRGALVPAVGDAAGRLISERLEKASVDCGPLVDRVVGLLAALLPGGRERVDQTLRSVSFGQPRVFMFNLALKMSMAIEPLPSVPKVPAGIGAAREERLKRWDAFVTFVSKRLGRNRSREQQRGVSAVLLNARYELVEAEEIAEPTSPDPVPGLFMRTWKRLRPVALELSRDTDSAPGPDLEIFVTAGGVLAALTAQEKALNYQVTDDGMRAVARIADPDSREDPLAYDTGVDPELRRLFGFGDPLPQPVVSPITTVQRAPDENLAPPHFFDFMMPLRSWLLATAWATEEPDPVAKLNAWVPRESELTAYLELVKTLLVNLGEEALAKHPLGDPYAQVYRDLVLATAWQESCWRQFVRKGDAVVPLVSAASSVGLMQVNPRVWRGVYDVEGLYRDIRYNGRAGCEILLHYLRDYAIAKGEDKLEGGIDNLPRAAYAIYNGGPGQRARYRSSATGSSLKKIDAALWQKYSAVREGREMEVAGCYQ